MSYQMDMTCLFSTVKNTSGGSKTFGFLPPHGRKLAANEELSFFGSVHEAVLVAGNRNVSQRNINALQAALDRGDLKIISTPAPIVLDQTTGDSKMVQLNNTTLSTVDPCFMSSAAA